MGKESYKVCVLVMCALLAAGPCNGNGKVDPALRTGQIATEPNNTAGGTSRVIPTVNKVGATEHLASSEKPELKPLTESTDGAEATISYNNSRNGKNLTAENKTNNTNARNTELVRTAGNNTAGGDRRATNGKDANNDLTGGKKMRTETYENNLINFSVLVSATEMGVHINNDTEAVLAVGNNVNGSGRMEPFVNNNNNSSTSRGEGNEGQRGRADSSTGPENTPQTTASNVQTDSKQNISSNNMPDKQSETNEIKSINVTDHEGYFDNISSKEACDRLLSVVVTRWKIFDNGSLLSLDNNPVLYPPEFFWKEFNDDNITEVRGCICLMKHCIRKCCPEEQTMTQNKSCVYSNSSLLHPFSPQFADEDINNPAGIVDLYRVYGNPCRNETFLLEPEYDQFSLLRTGVLSVPNEGDFTVAQYCIEAFEDMEQVLPMLCFPEEEASEAANEIYLMYPIGMIISVPFLLATFVVYAVIPELRNLHGKSLMCHVSSLLTAYTFLAVVQLGGNRLSNELCTFCGKCLHHFR
jgi:hypothetical protein